MLSRVLLLLAALALAACGGESTPVAPQLKAAETAGSLGASLTLDAATYRYASTVPITLTFRNSGQGTIWLRRTCETQDTPAAQLVRPAGDSTPIFIGWGSTICTGNAPPYPEPIRVRPQESVSWSYSVRNSLPDAQSSAPITWFTGDFRIVLLAQNTTRIVDSAGDLIPLEFRITAPFRIEPP